MAAITKVFLTPYIYRETLDPARHSDQRSQRFLALLHDYLSPHVMIRERRPCNYEDLFSAAQRIVDDVMLEGVEPLIGVSIDELSRTSSFLHAGERRSIGESSFATLAYDSTVYIKEWVRTLLLPSIVYPPVGLKAVAELSSILNRIDIFTLNHDVLLERSLEAANIPYVDGFSPTPEQKGRRFLGDWPLGTAKIRLLKLHGCICVWRYSESGRDVYFSNRDDPFMRRNNALSDPSLLPSCSTAEFITGTTIKERLYGTGITRKVVEHFDTLLPEHDLLVCCGYGWADKVINNRLAEWLVAAPRNRILILHGKDPGLQHPRDSGFWAKRWDESKVRVHEQWLCELDGVSLARLIADFGRQ